MCLKRRERRELVEDVVKKTAKPLTETYSRFHVYLISKIIQFRFHG